MQSTVSKETTTSGSGTPTQNIGTGSQAKEKGWVKGNKDEAGMKKCQSQAEQRDKWMKDQEEKRKSKGKGKKEEGQSKGKGSDEVIEIKDDDEPTSYQ